MDANVDPTGGQPVEPLLSVVDLTRHFRLGGLFSKSILHAVDDVNFSINEREIVALVGESGSGKTTMARLLAMIYPPTRGDVRYRGRSIRSLRRRRDALWYRGEVPMVFQDPYSSLHPVFRVSHAVMRQLRLHRPELDGEARQREAERVFETVGLNPASDMLKKYPHEMSGGQRQRVGFAAALAVRPTLILADEPVSMLDVSIRIGLLNMMAGLRDQENLSILYITHDLASARYIADRILVMYAGHLVESGPAETVLSRAKHPYTQLLLSAVPELREKVTETDADADTDSDTGEPPKVINPTEGCRFRWRCPYAIDQCSQVTPRLRSMGAGHEAACHVAVPDGEASQGSPASVREDGAAVASADSAVSPARPTP
jgi:oligopeptide/dipeptide ABC transporter ATP-binding protein